jgi:hypothetical protein
MVSLFAVCLLLACREEGTDTKGATTTPAVAGTAPAATKVSLGKNVFLETKGDKRRVLVQAEVCLRQGGLEQLLTRKGTKEHEAILAADVDARDIHAALLVAGAEAGKPVQFRPKYQPASGTVIKITLAYEQKGKKIEVPARSWIRQSQKKKELEQDWVFAGSYFVPNPDDKAKKPFYAANEGDVICVSNFDTAMLDLPIQSTDQDAELAFEAYTERIPAKETPVTVILQPVAKK